MTFKNTVDGMLWLIIHVFGSIAFVVVFWGALFIAAPILSPLICHTLVGLHDPFYPGSVNSC